MGITMERPIFDNRGKVIALCDKCPVVRKGGGARQVLVHHLVVAARIDHILEAGVPYSHDCAGDESDDHHQHPPFYVDGVPNMGANFGVICRFVEEGVICLNEGAEHM